MIELALIGLTITGFLVLLDRKDHRFHRLLQEKDERAQEREREHRAEVAQLLQRIQAPEVAVVEHNQAQQLAPTVLHALTDEQAAEAEERARVIAEMERIENEALR